MKSSKPGISDDTRQKHVCIVGAGTRFLSGITYYTFRLTNALAEQMPVSAILLRQLLPIFLYPGHSRVGESLTDLQIDTSVPYYDGIDWFWIPSIFRALVFFARQKPDVVIFEWWTGTVLHTYLALAAAARVLGVRIILEFHEVQDIGEANLVAARAYVHLLMPLLLKLTDGFVVHSQHDQDAIKQTYPISDRPVKIVHHGPYEHHCSQNSKMLREAPEESLNLLYFGVIRPFKGVEDLVAAFNSIPPDEIQNYWLTVIGEPWEGWTLPAEAIATSPYRNRITYVNRYVNDKEVAAYFAGADVVVLPYHRSSASGPLHIAMSHGLPVIVTQVGGLPEAIDGYNGALLIPPHDPEAILKAIQKATRMKGQRFQDVHSWLNTVAQVEGLIDTLLSSQR
jgi:glycosyltransferase involved in cell wall biosynthesis